MQSNQRLSRFTRSPFKKKKKKKKRFILKKDKKFFKKVLDTLQQIAYNIIVRLKKERGQKWHCS